MPNPKSGTVTENMKAVHDVKHGQVRFKTEQAELFRTIANSSMDVIK